MTEKMSVIIIEDNMTDADTYGRLLEMHGPFEVENIDARDFAELHSYADLVSVGRADVIIVDQRLDERAGVGYGGIDIVEFLRSLGAQLPIYVLTQYRDDLGTRVMDVEDVINKGHFGDLPEVYAKRILRAAGRYRDALDQRRQRFLELIDMKTKGTITIELNKELETLRAEIERVETFVLESNKVICSREYSEESRLLLEALDHLRQINSKLPFSPNGES